MTNEKRWLTTEEAATEVGMTSEWVRKQIAAGRLDAQVWATGRRRTFRVPRDSWDAFRQAFSAPAEPDRETSREA